MQTQLLIEEIRLLQQRRQQQQQQELLQQRLSSATASSYPLSSALINSLSTLGGAAASGTPTGGNPLSDPAAASTSAPADSLLLRELQQKLMGSATAGLGNALGGAPAPLDLSSLLGGTTTTVGSSLSSAMGGAASAAISPAAMSNEDLLRTVAAAGFLNQQNATSALSGQQLQTLNPGATLASLPSSLLGSLVSTGTTGTLDRNKRDTDSAALEGFGAASDLRTQLQASKRQRLLSNASETVVAPSSWQRQNASLDPAAAAVHVLASAAAEMERKEATKRVTGTLSFSGNSFPLPPEKEEKEEGTANGFSGMPKLTAFRAVWDNVKTKKMQKEIFLRKLHQGKLTLSSASISKSNSATETIGGAASQAHGKARSEAV